MASERLTLSCQVAHDHAHGENHDNEDMFWKRCIWIRMSDNAKCQLTSDNHGNVITDNCDSTMGQIQIGTAGQFDRLECSITLPDAQQRDNGEWKCVLHKCKDKSDGGCHSKYSSNCSSEITINAQVYSKG